MYYAKTKREINVITKDFKGDQCNLLVGHDYYAWFGALYLLNWYNLSRSNTDNTRFISRYSFKIKYPSYIWKTNYNNGGKLVIQQYGREIRILFLLVKESKLCHYENTFLKKSQVGAIDDSMAAN